MLQQQLFSIITITAGNRYKWAQYCFVSFVPAERIFQAVG